MKVLLQIYLAQVDAASFAMTRVIHPMVQYAASDRIAMGRSLARQVLHGSIIAYSVDENVK